MRIIKIFTVILIFFSTLILSVNKISAQSDTCVSQNGCQALISSLQSKISDLKGQENTFSNQIAVMNSQIQLTQARIYETQQQIIGLEEDISSTIDKIGNLNNTFANLSKVFYNRIRKSYEVGLINPLQSLLTVNNINNFVTRESFLKIVEANDRQSAFNTVQAKNDYTNQKQILESKRKQLASLQDQLQNYTIDLNSQKQQKQNLLVQTQGSEANYQSLLSQAKAQLAGFSNFVNSQGGAGLLANQTYCDSWGCYYNQRDSQWGGVSLNNTQYTIASDGCLMTSVAMVMTHYGHKTTPLDINSNSSNFASYYPAYLLYTVHADGVGAQRIGTSIDSTLSSGNPVIVGIYAYGGTHFVVLKSGSSGNYIMDDPYLANGHDISFTDHYSINSIFEVDKVAIL